MLLPRADTKTITNDLFIQKHDHYIITHVIFTVILSFSGRIWLLSYYVIILRTKAETRRVNPVAYHLSFASTTIVQPSNALLITLFSALLL